MSKGAAKSAVEIAGPAKDAASHIWDRQLSDESGKPILGKTGCRNETQFQRAVRLAQLVDKSVCTDERQKAIEIERALDRRDAGIAFVEAWDIRDRGSKDSLDLNRGGSAASAAGISDAQIDAANLLRSWESRMGQNDWMLVRRVCGENYTVAQSVSEISPSYKDSSLARFREALTALHGAQMVTQRQRSR